MLSRWLTYPRSELRESKKPVVGLIGGIGAGKSLVARFFGEFGGRLIEGDKLGHDALQEPVIRETVVARWQTRILKETGEIDRRKLAAVVFGDANERRALE